MRWYYVVHELQTALKRVLERLWISVCIDDEKPLKSPLSAFACAACNQQLVATLTVLYCFQGTLKGSCHESKSLDKNYCHLDIILALKIFTSIFL